MAVMQLLKICKGNTKASQYNDKCEMLKLAAEPNEDTLIRTSLQPIYQQTIGCWQLGDKPHQKLVSVIVT